MSEFSKDVLQRRLHKRQGEVGFHRTITVEVAVITGNEFVVRVEHAQTTGRNYGLQDPKVRIPSSYTATQKVFPLLTFQLAIEFAEKEFKRSVEHEHFTPLAVGENFPF